MVNAVILDYRPERFLDMLVMQCPFLPAEERDLATVKAHGVFGGQVQQVYSV